MRRDERTERTSELIRSPDFLAVLGDLCHVQDAALLRRLEEDRKSSARASHTSTPPPEQSGPAASAFINPAQPAKTRQSGFRTRSFYSGGTFSFNVPGKRSSKRQILENADDLEARTQTQSYKEPRRKREDIKGVLTEVGGGEGQESESGEGGCGPRGASCWGDRDQTLNSDNNWRRR